MEAVVSPSDDELVHRLHLAARKIETSLGISVLLVEVVKLGAVEDEVPPLPSFQDASSRVQIALHPLEREEDGTTKAALEFPGTLLQLSREHISLCPRPLGGPSGRCSLPTH